MFTEDIPIHHKALIISAVINISHPHSSFSWSFHHHHLEPNKRERERLFYSLLSLTKKKFSKIDRDMIVKADIIVVSIAVMFRIKFCHKLSKKKKGGNLKFRFITRNILQTFNGILEFFFFLPKIFLRPLIKF